MAPNAIRWLSRHLAMLFQQRARPRLGHLALPAEIILIIAEYLSKPSVISLSLACRTLYTLCFPALPDLDPAEKEELLLLLEKDVACLYFCPHCVKLHPWYTWWRHPWSPWSPDELYSMIACKSNAKLNLPFTRYIPFHHARLVMNGHFYGPAHGFPAKWLEDREQLTWTDGTKVSETLRARIVDDQLMLAIEIVMSHGRGDARKLRETVDSMGNLVCEHMTLKKGHGRYPARCQLPELVKENSAPDEFTPCSQSVGSCTVCLTDYCTDICWRGEKKGWVVKVAVYQQLGTCRSPFDRNWIALTKKGVWDSRSLSSLEREAGSVIARWNNDLAMKPQGERITGPGEEVTSQQSPHMTNGNSS